MSISSTFYAGHFRTKVFFCRQNVTREKHFRTKKRVGKMLMKLTLDVDEIDPRYAVVIAQSLFSNNIKLLSRLMLGCLLLGDKAIK